MTDLIDRLKGLSIALRKRGYPRNAKLIDEAADALEAAREDAWLPIETAPKDGSEMILARGDRVTYGHWLSDEGWTVEHRDVDGRWIGQDESDGWEGWMSWDGGFLEEDPPTHWRPLGAPPAIDAARKEVDRE